MKRITALSILIVLVMICGCKTGWLQSTDKTADLKPVIAGYGVGAFKTGKLLYSSDFADLEDWVVQIQPVEGFGEPAVVAVDNTLDAYLPGRGCTIWNKNKFQGPIAIIYKVVCPAAETDVEVLNARDINNFWHSSGSDTNPNLFDSDVYDGGFGNYHQINCYYASTGGGGVIGNKTTRFRRYPRMNDGENVDHLSLTDKDEKKEFLITPGKVHTIQLVAFNDIIQYIVDGVVVYQIKYGDTVTVETNNNGKLEQYEVEYNGDNFPYYKEGYFGFRMVRTHHIYSDFKVYRLVAAE